MNWISRVLCLLGRHGPKKLGEVSQYRSCVGSENPSEFKRSSYEPREHRRCMCCGAAWKRSSTKWVRNDIS